MNVHLRHIEQLALRALVVGDVLRAEHIRRLSRLDELELLAVKETVLEREHGLAALIALDRHTHDLVFADVLAVAVVLAVLLAAEVEAGVILAVADLIDLVAAELRQNEAVRVFSVRIDGGTVRAGDTRGVIRRFVAALDLERGDTRPDKLRNVLDHAHILGVVQIGAASVLLDREELARALLLHERIVPAARLGARAVVGIAAGHVLRDKAAAGVRNAHRAVYERLDLKLLRGLCADLGDLLERKLAREHDALRALLRPEVRRLVVEDAGLGGDVNGHARRVLSRHTQHAHIRDDERIRARIGQQLQIRRECGQVAV